MTAFSLEYSIDVDEASAVIYIKAFGVWQASTAIQYRKDFEKAIQPLLGRPWARFADLSKMRAAHQDVVNIIAKLQEWSKENQSELSLYVLNSPSIYRQLTEAFRKAGVTETSKTFRTLPEAEKYLKEHWLEKISRLSP